MGNADGPVLGIIGGSGLGSMPGLRGTWREVGTPWGAPSDAVLDGTLAGRRVLFLARHGRGHVHTPASVPRRANLCALKDLGATHVVSVSAVGSLREAMAPGDVVVVDQFIDRTEGRARSFFGPGLVAHVGAADPVCAGLSVTCATAARDAGARVHEGGSYVAIEGPQFATRAESTLHRGMGADVVGMTAMPEALLAREAELHYAVLATVTDYDSWRPGHAAVDVAEVLDTLRRTRAAAQRTVALLAERLDGACGTGCATALDGAVMTAPDRRDPAMVERLRPVAGRVL
ncbi:S-methyl-5'-thioadenosine phosphorylase [Jannaschia sp. W003]|uniref:phosphorylase family protein n=1 Tax=Jannaschia sp. W003 TaxID=2867012 RepID=UPI0021A8413B|nr:S-methyl-5'-thioadenosine phosphorylase [Jannaschia sp. W003]UWQ21381.1 S-methyl-5'-thioadenosine phosphorylase [Jannaschia sp. W003]